MDKNTNPIKSYKDLIVWQKSIRLVSEIYKISKKFPVEERYGLTSQIQRAAVSVPSNIAEGRGRRSRKDFVQFLYFSLGSLAELDTQLIIAKELSYIEKADYNTIEGLLVEVRMMLSKLLASLKAGT